MLLLPVPEELVPGQEHRPKLSIVDSSQADTAESPPPATSPERLHEAADNLVRETGSGWILLDDRNKKGVRVSCQEQVEEIFGEGMLAVVGSGDGLDSIQQMRVSPQLTAHLWL
jgi:hypothetical protein